MGRADLKKEAIERIDELIIGPMLAGLGALGRFRDSADAGSRDAEPAQDSFAGTRPVRADDVGAVRSRAAACARRYTESDGTATGLLVGDGYHLIESLFGSPLKTASN